MVDNVVLREPFNAISHFIGVLLAVAGLSYLVAQAEGALAIAAYTIYGTGLVALYLASGLYHGLKVPERWIEVLQRADHTAIYLLIAGTYTPICLLAIPPAWGWSLFGVVWGLAIAGILVRNVVSGIPRWVNTAIYIALGWSAVIGAGPLVETFTWGALAWLLAGGLLYTLGAVIYATEWPDPLPDHFGAHGIWHLFVLGGSAAHFVFIAAYVPPV